MIALDADVDLVQGYYFARPQPLLAGLGEESAEIAALWGHFDSRLKHRRSGVQERVAPYQTALALAMLPLQQGKPLAEACEAFLAPARLPDRLPAGR